MITIDTQESRINVTVLGEFTVADFKEFEEVAMQLGGGVDLFIDLREMSGVTVDMALEEIRFARAHPNDFARIAVLTQDQWVSWSAWLICASHALQWVSWSAWLAQIFLNADVRVFDDSDDAEAWLTGAEPPVA